MSNKGKGQDAWCAKASNYSTTQWCKRYIGNASACFDVDLYGSQGALICATYWSAKMDLYYNQWMELGGPEPYSYTREQVQAFREPTDFTEFTRAEGPHLKAQATKRFDELRALAPDGPCR